jgi:hypothetical protein
MAIARNPKAARPLAILDPHPRDERGAERHEAEDIAAGVNTLAR